MNIITFVAIMVCQNWLVPEYCEQDFKDCVSREIIFEEGDQVKAIEKCIKRINDDISQYDKTE